MKARDIMTPKPFFVTPADDVCKAAEIMRYEDIGGVPVVESELRLRLVGLITDRDIATRCVARRHQHPCPVRDVMTPAPLRTVHLEADVSEIVRLMEEGSVRRIPVLSDDGVLIGIVAEADIATKLPAEEALPLRKRVKGHTAISHRGRELR